MLQPLKAAGVSAGGIGRITACLRTDHQDAAAWINSSLSNKLFKLNTGQLSVSRLNAPARYRSQRKIVGGVAFEKSRSEKRRKPSTSSTTKPAGISRRL